MEARLKNKSQAVGEYPGSQFSLRQSVSLSLSNVLAVCAVSFRHVQRGAAQWEAAKPAGHGLSTGTVTSLIGSVDLSSRLIDGDVREVPSDKAMYSLKLNRLFI